jgi:hypothetical protein
MKKSNNFFITKRVSVISITLLILSLAYLPIPESVVGETYNVSVELEAGWNFVSMPLSISASDLALKSEYITSIVHKTFEGSYVLFVPSLGATNFICEAYEEIYIYSEADTTITFPIIISEYIDGDLIITGDTTIGGTLTTDNFTINKGFTFNGNYNIAENMTIGGDLVVSGNITGITMGDMANFVIGRDEKGIVYARNGATGSIDYQSPNASEVIQSAVDTINKSNQGGVVYIRKSDYYETYNIPGRFSVKVDYTLDDTIRVPDGISIISDGALLKVIDINGTVFEMNPDGVSYSSIHLNWKISGLSLVGINNNTDNCAIHIKRWQSAFQIDNIHTEHINYPVKIEGEAYRTVVQNCLFVGGSSAYGQGGKIGVHIFQGGGDYGPNAATIINSDISSFENGIKIDAGYGVRVTNNYFENNAVAIKINGGQHITAISNYVQPGRNATGIYVGGGIPTITANTFLLGADATGAYGIFADKGCLVNSNFIVTDSGSNAFFYSEISVSATIDGNVAGLKPGSTSKLPLFLIIRLIGVILLFSKETQIQAGEISLLATIFTTQL